MDKESTIPIKVAKCCHSCLHWKNADVKSKSLRFCNTIRRYTTGIMVCAEHEENERVVRGRLAGIQGALSQIERKQISRSN